MKIKDGFILRKFADKYLSVAVGDAADKFNVLITLNETGAFVWDLMQEDVSYDFVIEQMLENYEVDRETAIRDLDEFLEKTRSAGLIDE